MKSLDETLAEIRDRILRYSSSPIGEQNTKGVLIEPVLAALGWDLGDLDEVRREYKQASTDNPVDYALLVSRTPRLFVEAKALGENLGDRRWANQIMGYAAVAGVEWVVLTDGNEYRLYNSHAPVPVEAKLFRTVRIADDPDAAQTLCLLARDRVQANSIGQLWRAHYVDQRLRAILEDLFSASADPSFVQFLAERDPTLSRDQIREGLARVRVRLDLPEEPAAATVKPTDPAKNAPAPSATPTQIIPMSLPKSDRESAEATDFNAPKANLLERLQALGFEAPQAVSGRLVRIRRADSCIGLAFRESSYIQGDKWWWGFKEVDDLIPLSDCVTVLLIGLMQDSGVPEKARPEVLIVPWESAAALANGTKPWTEMHRIHINVFKHRDNSWSEFVIDPINLNNALLDRILNKNTISSSRESATPSIAPAEAMTTSPEMRPLEPLPNEPTVPTRSHEPPQQRTTYWVETPEGRLSTRQALEELFKQGNPYAREKKRRAGWQEEGYGLGTARIVYEALARFPREGWSFHPKPPK